MNWRTRLQIVIGVAAALVSFNAAFYSTHVQMKICQCVEFMVAAYFCTCTNENISILSTLFLAMINSIQRNREKDNMWCITTIAKKLRLKNIYLKESACIYGPTSDVDILTHSRVWEIWKAICDLCGLLIFQCPFILLLIFRSINPL